jgi:hypothetical protein
LNDAFAEVFTTKDTATSTLKAERNHRDDDSVQIGFLSGAVFILAHELARSFVPLGPVGFAFHLRLKLRPLPHRALASIVSWRLIGSH